MHAISDEEIVCMRLLLRLDAVHKLTYDVVWCLCGVRPSVCLSVTFVYILKTTKHILEMIRDRVIVTIEH